MDENNLITIRIKRSDCKILDSLKDHPRQPLYEVLSELLQIVTESKKRAK